jgi:hypothetical protein
MEQGSGEQGARSTEHGAKRKRKRKRKRRRKRRRTQVIRPI